MKMLTTVAALAAVLVAGAGMAQTASAATPAPMHRGQFASNANIRVATAHVERAIDQLQQDRATYGGHRVAAINDLTQARTDLNQALVYVDARRTGSKPPVDVKTSVAD